MTSATAAHAAAAIQPRPPRDQIRDRAGRAAQWHRLRRGLEACAYAAERARTGVAVAGSVASSNVPPMSVSLSVFELQVLEQIVELSKAATNKPVSYSAVLEALPEGTELREMNVHVRSLADANFVHLDERYAGAWLAQPTDAGRAAWAEIYELRSSPRTRRRQMRDDYLIWLYDQHEDGSSPTSDDFLNTGAHYVGAPYTQEDLERTGEWLLERGLIKGPTGWQRPDPIRPQITAKGQLYVEEGKSVHESPESVGAATYNTTINGPAMLAQNSQYVTQNQNINAWKDDARSFAEAVAHLASILPDSSELAVKASELHQEVDDAARPNRVRELVDTIVRALGSGAGGALGGALVTQAGAVLASLPM